VSDAVETHIKVGGETHFVGTCRYLAKGRRQSSVFEYSREWLARAGAFPIDPVNLPIRAEPFYFTSEKSGLPGALRDAAPDRWGQLLIKRAFRKAGEERALSEFDFLLALNDETRIGALRFKRSGEASFDHDPGARRIPPLITLPALLNAADAVHSNTETADDLKLLLNEGSPLGGARPKSAILDEDGALAIAKFPKPDDERSVPHGEVLALMLAKRAGINAAAARIVDVAGRAVAIVRRFDRDDAKRIHFLSAMTLLNVEDGDEATYTDIAEIIRIYSAEPIMDLHELWRRIVFGILASNLDDHLRNHGFLHVGGDKWRLSPAYDLNPTPAAERPREFTTWISEEGPDARLSFARKAAKYFAVKPADAGRIIGEVAAAIADWRKAAQKIGMSKADIGAYSSAFRAPKDAE
jgi:serine/threonine-protein kinase HipA